MNPNQSPFFNQSTRVFVPIIIIFALFFLAFSFIFGFCMFNLADFNRHGAKTQATVSDMYIENDEFMVVVSYQVDGVWYEEVLNLYDGDVFLNEKIEISYLLDNPTEIIDQDALNVGAIVFGIAGLMMLTGFVFFIVYFSKQKRKENLKHTGRKIVATVTSIKLTIIGVGASCTAKIFCKSSAGEEFVTTCLVKVFFISAIKQYQPNGETIDVYLDPADSKKYFVDIDSFVPNQQNFSSNFANNQNNNFGGQGSSYEDPFDSNNKPEGFCSDDSQDNPFDF